MKPLEAILESNKAWAAGVRERQPDFFEDLAKQQTPDYLWIGCADSRVPATEICGLMPGQIFVHRNVANLLVNTDLNALSVIQYAIEVLRVKHVIVCGHYGCGGVKAALGHAKHGLIDNWLRHIKDVAARHIDELAAISDDDARTNRLCELNVRAQVANLCQTTIVQDAWAKGQPLAVHGLIYGLGDGILKPLGDSIQGVDAVSDIYRMNP
jgi:carbonic anhydrase